MQGEKTKRTKTDLTDLGVGGTVLLVNRLHPILTLPVHVPSETLASNNPHLCLHSPLSLHVRVPPEREAYGFLSLING